jgi:hypothetical protein
MRELGWLEGSFLSSDLTIVAVATIDGVLDDDILRKCCLQTQRRHPNLRICCRFHEGAPCFDETTTAVSFESFKMENSGSFDLYLNEMVNTSFDLLSDRNLLWSVKSILICSEDTTKLCITTHHAIADGTSSFIIINDILQSYEDNYIGGLATSPAPSDVTLDFLPDVEKICFPNGKTNEDNSSATIILNELKDFRSSWTPMIPYEVGTGGGAGSPARPVRNDHILWENPPEQFSAVMVRCKAEGVTFGALFIAALHFAVAKMCHAEGRFSTPWQFTHDIDVNLRKHCPLPLGNDHVGLLIGMMQVAAIHPAPTPILQPLHV